MLADPVETIAKGAPRVIHNDRELETYSEVLFQLTSLKRPNRAQREAIELLTLLAERYEAERYAIPPAEPIAVVRFLMQGQGLKQRDLIPEFGSESVASMFLAGKRKLTLNQVRKLCSRFKLPADVFVETD